MPINKDNVNWRPEVIVVAAYLLFFTSYVSGSRSYVSRSRSKRFGNVNCSFQFPSETILQGFSASLTYFSFVAFFDRPRGVMMIDPACIESKNSQIEGAGAGLFAKTDIPEGTVLGTYPGVIRPTSKFLKKIANKPDAGTYAWRFNDNLGLIDPTDQNGELQDLCFGGTDDFPFSYFLHRSVLNRPVSTLLARINEPPIGGSGCNIFINEDLKKMEVTFYLSRNVAAGEEFFMDYGLSYDRSLYNGPVQ